MIFQTKGRKQFQIWLDRYAKYQDLILPILAEHEMPEELMYLAMIESGLNPRPTVKQMPQECGNLFIPQENIRPE